MTTQKFALLPLICTFAACTTVALPAKQPAPTASAGAAPKTAERIPYPQINADERINTLALQVARLEHALDTLNTRVLQLEHTPKAAKKPAAPVQRLNDEKLKHHYLAQSDGATGSTPSSENAELRLYRQALKLYQNRRYTEAAVLLKDANGGNGGETAQRSMYLLLKSQQAAGNCESVIDIGSRYANRFRSNPQAAEALYSIAQCQYDMQQKDIARATWRKLMQIYPESRAAKRAAVRLKSR